MPIEKLRAEHIPEVARLHQELIYGTFFSELGRGFLEVLYTGILESGESFSYVWTEKGRIAGLVSGSTDTKRMFSVIFRRKWIQLSLSVLARGLTRPSVIPKALSYLRYPFGAEGAELLSLAVKPEFRRKGIANKLLTRLFADLRKTNISRFSVLVGVHLKGAQAFYKRMGFKFEREIGISSNRLLRYGYKIKART